MSGFLFAFVAALLIGQGARDQLLVAQMAARAQTTIMAAGWAAAAASAVVMAFAGASIAGILPTSGRRMLVAFSLIAAAVELAWPNRDTAAAEPTRSVFAAFLVLCLRQFGDASRFIIFALAAATAIPALVALGGALGGVAAITLGWLAGERLEKTVPLRALRLALAAATLVAGVVIGLSARGLIL